MVDAQSSGDVMRASPGLTALVVYLRPTPRGRLLALLAGLGIFVIEHRGITGALQTAYTTRSDFVIVSGQDDQAHHALVRELLEALSSVVVAIVPEPAAAAGYTAAGAGAVLNQSATDAELVDLLRPAVQQARLLREIGEFAAEYVVFRDVRFMTRPPRLVREQQEVQLARSESEVLAELLQAHGNPVPVADLQRRLAAISPREHIQPGYVKTIVLRLRRKVEELGGDPGHLRNLRGFGYLLTE